MNVVYDISIFGSVESSPATRAGIYRVVESVARVLSDSGRCSIHFGAFEKNLYNSTLKHLLSSSEYKDIYLPHFPYSKTHEQLTGLFSQLNGCVWEASGIKKKGWRALRKLTGYSKEWFNTDSENDVNLQKADIFHSPFYAIPARVRKHKNVKPFLTVYDLIPILYPQFFETAKDGSDHPLKTIVDGIGREDWVVCISQSTKDDLCNYRKDLDPRRIFVTHLGASKWFYPCKDKPTIEKIRSKYKIPPGRYVLSVCTLEPRKNLAHLICCFAQLIEQEKLTDLHLVLVGNLGWKYESIFAELTSAKGLRDRIIITDYVNDEDMAALYSGSLFFAYPSFYEGFGLPPLEAMQCGVPVITSNTSSLPEVVDDTGIMVDPRDSDALCQAMLKLASDANLREAMSQKSLQQATQFSWARCADQTLNAYQIAVSGNID
jgi:glycosyltransferase involved in cell wall biosynthesis